MLDSHYLTIIVICFRYGVVIVTSDIRSLHSSDGEDSDLTSQRTVRVKRTLPNHINKQSGPNIEQLPDKRTSE